MNHEYRRLAVFEHPTLLRMAIDLGKFVINYFICRIKCTILNLINVCRVPGASILPD
jgi:hypothetical protein